VAGRLKVVFLPNFNVSMGERVYPAADPRSRSRWPARKRAAPATMKLALNGRPDHRQPSTAPTSTSASLVGDDNFFLFGMTAEEVQARKNAGYRPHEPLAASRELRSALAQIASGVFFRRRLQPLSARFVDNLLVEDPYMLLADFDSYVAAQDRAEQAFRMSSAGPGCRS